MAEQEKITLVLDVTGVQDVRLLRQNMEDLAQAMGVVDYKFDQTAVSANQAAAAVDDLADAASQAGGAGGGGGGRTPSRPGGGGQEKAGKSQSGQNLLTLAFAVDDLQYGLRGVMNNIPMVVQALGLGAGLAGVAGIAAVAIGTLVKHSEDWFGISDKLKTKLVELVDVLEAEAAAVKQQKEAVDKLGESNKTRAEDLIRLKIATEELKQSEEQLASVRAARKAAEDAEKNKGVLDKEELDKNVGIFKDFAVDTGLSGDIQAEMRKRLAGDPNLRGAASEAAGMAPFDENQTGLQSLAEEVAQANGWDIRYAVDLLRRNPAVRADAEAKYGAAAKQRTAGLRDTYDKNLTQNIFGRMAGSAKNTEDFNQAFRGFSAIMPGDAAFMNQVRGERDDDEAFQAGLAKRTAANAKRRSGMAADDAEQRRIDAVVDDFGEDLVGDQVAARRKAEREASIREAAVARSMMNQGPWQNQVAAARNAAIEQGGSPAEVAALNQRNQMAVMNQMREGFEKSGFSQAESVEASQRLMGSVMESLERMLRMNQASLDFYGRLQIHMQNFDQRMNIQAAEFQNAAFGAGVRGR